MDALSTLLQSGKPILLDGAMGTMLMEAGMEAGESPEEWNVLHPDKVRKIHQAYIQAGSQIILTNSFGGSSIRLETHELADRVVELNRAAGANARAEADGAAQTGLVRKGLFRLSSTHSSQGFHKLSRWSNRSGYQDCLGCPICFGARICPCSPI